MWGILAKAVYFCNFSDFVAQNQLPLTDCWLLIVFVLDPARMNLPIGWKGVWPTLSKVYVFGNSVMQCYGSGISSNTRNFLVVFLFYKHAWMCPRLLTFYWVIINITIGKFFSWCLLLGHNEYNEFSSPSTCIRFPVNPVHFTWVLRVCHNNAGFSDERGNSGEIMI